MYQIKYVHRNSTVEKELYTPGSADYILTEGRLRIGRGISGELDISIPSINPARNDLVCLTDEVVFYRNGIELWRGRPVTVQTDFDHTGKVHCEGCLRYLYDTFYPPYEFSGRPEELLTAVVQNHNVQVDAQKRFKVGMVTVTDPNNYIVRSSEEYSRSLAVLDEKLQRSSLGGYLRVRVQNGEKYLDYLSSYNTTSSQPARYGYNILDIADEIEYADLITAVLPLGASSEDAEGNTSTLNISSVNNGDVYISDNEAVSRYGWICECVTWRDVTLPENLIEKARAYLAAKKSAIRTITVKAVDMNLADSSVRSWQLGDEIQITSAPHGIDISATLDELEIDVLNIDNNTLTFGSSVTLTEQLNRNQTDVEDKITQETFNRKNAYQELQKALGESSGFHVTEEKQGDGSSIYYLHNSQTVASSQFVMKLTAEAIGLSTDGGKSYPYGFTINGEMVMDWIQTRGLDAEYVYIGNETVTESINGVKDTLTNLTVEQGRIVASVQSAQKAAQDAQDAANKSIAGVDVMYASGSSATTAPTTGWQTTAPAWQAGKHIWQKTVTTYGDGTSDESAPTCISGADGAKGDAGLGIKAIVEQYYLSNSSISCSGGSWSETSPTWVSGKYIWTRSKITWSDNSVTYTTAQLAKALNSANSNAADAKGQAAANKASIELLEDSITSKVEKTDYTGTTIVSMINQTASTVAISAQHIKLEGIVTANDNFKVLSDGSIECKNAVIAGKVEATSGFIGSADNGWKLSENCLRHLLLSDAEGVNIYYDTFVQAPDGISTSNAFVVRQTGSAPASGSGSKDWAWNGSEKWFYRFQVNYKGDFAFRSVNSYYSNGMVKEYSQLSMSNGVFQNITYYQTSSGENSYPPSNASSMRIAGFRCNNFYTPGSATRCYTDYCADGIEYRGKSYIYFTDTATGGYSNLITFNASINIGTGSIRATNDENCTICDCSESGTMYFGAASGYIDESSKTVLRGKSVRIYSHKSGAVYLGSSGSTAVTSDENLKDILEIDPRYEVFFEHLTPVAYRYKNNGHRVHLGYGARAVENALLAAGLSTEEFAGLLIDHDVTIGADESQTETPQHYESFYSLRYEEFGALYAYMLKKALVRISKLEARVEELS